ncbi:MAG: phosphotransferase [Nocardioides sp.]|uniref:phosphotransferase family protein n=1 Tax=Nocardioides sp. TaxID=35761 RepID=UPI0023A38374|nr:phosphotransferase [Nocardioides sp.]MDE0777342.1 phosphotransferase [Nocardioides sp.]
MHPEEVPPAVLADVARAVDAEVAVVGRLAGGVNGGAVRVRMRGRGDAVLKATPWSHPDQLEDARRARRVVDHMRGRGYPTPAWLGVGSTATHVWQLTELVDAAPAHELTPSLVDQLVAIVDLQAGQASEPHDHWQFAWRVVTGRQTTAGDVAAHSAAVASLVDRMRRAHDRLEPPPMAPDMVHADLNPSNVLVRDGVVVALVDIGNAGSGTRASDLVTLQWHTFRAPLDGARHRLRGTVVDLVGWEWAAALTATQVLLQLEWRLRSASADAVAQTIERGHRAFDELDELR